MHFECKIARCEALGPSLQPCDAGLSVGGTPAPMTARPEDNPRLVVPECTIAGCEPPDRRHLVWNAQMSGMCLESAGPAVATGNIARAEGYCYVKI